MLINSKVLNIPPFISVQWNQIEFLTTQENILIINLKSGKVVQIPDLPTDIIQRVFSMHGSYAEIERSVQIPPIPPIPQHSPLIGTGAVKIAFTSLDPGGLGIPLQHMEELRDAPDLPDEVLEKVMTISKLVPPEDLSKSPKPVEECNCPFCQIAGAIHSEWSKHPPVEEAKEEEVVKDEDLKFEQWIIHPKGNQLFEVQSKLDIHESYNVFLGNPVGCTCGKNGCEHILAVLKS